MKTKTEISSIKADDRIKKKVSWNDGQGEGQIKEEWLTINKAFSATKAVLDEHIKQLMKEGYSEIEATSIVGKPITPSEKLILNNPIYYDSKETIDSNKKLEKKMDLTEAEIHTKTVAGQEKPNQYGFFSMRNIVGIGIATLATVATIGIALSKRR